jgi:glycerol-3-phosphate acyltransferase PlsY
MIITIVVIAFILAYLLGSIPTSVWVGKLFHGIDVREHGSGNAGATNVIRILGWKTGVPVMIVDVGKGWLAGYLPVLFNLAEPGSGQMTTLQILTGVLPVFAAEKVSVLLLASFFHFIRFSHYHALRYS